MVAATTKPRRSTAFKLRPPPPPLEREEQAALFQWAKVRAVRDARYGLLFAIPNGTAASSLREAALAKKTGRKKGVPDVFLPIVRQCGPQLEAGLFVELKRKNGRLSDLSDEQEDWIAKLRQQGYRVRIAFGWEQARDFIEEYLQ